MSEAKQLNSALGMTLRKHRVAMGMRQTEVANLAGLSQAWYSRIENGMLEVTVPQLEVLAREFGLSVHALLEEALELRKLHQESNEGYPGIAHDFEECKRECAALQAQKEELVEAFHKAVMALESAGAQGAQLDQLRATLAEYVYPI